VPTRLDGRVVAKRRREVGEDEHVTSPAALAAPLTEELAVVRFGELTDWWPVGSDGGRSNAAVIEAARRHHRGVSSQPWTTLPHRAAAALALG
jgi:hypothetical protein